MKKYFIISAIYGAVGLLSGVFYREFTKLKDFGGVTVLANVHAHLLGLGMLVFLVVGLLAEKYSLEKYKSYKAFMIVYNVGVAFSALVLALRGIFQVTDPSNAHKSLSICAGGSHVILAAGLVLLFIALFKSVKAEEK